MLKGLAKSQAFQQERTDVAIRGRPVAYDTKKRSFAPKVKLYEVSAKQIAKKAQPGQFVILRVEEDGERVPLTIADFSRDQGTITLIVQEVGGSTAHLGLLEEGQAILDLVGPLGRKTHIESGMGTVVCIGGGIGIAPIYPIARGMKEAGNKVISIIGARSKDLLFWKDKMQAVSDTLYVTTDDGSDGEKGFVTTVLQRLIESGEKLDLVMAIGPVIMMRAVARTTQPFQLHTVVSLNPVMVDGTGMCGGCRVSVGADVKFACVDGPEFDAHQVDFEGLMNRQKTYVEQEKRHAERCALRQKEGECGCQ